MSSPTKYRDEVYEVAKRLHAECCPGCDKDADGPWLRFAQDVVDGRTTYEQAKFVGR